MRYIFELVKRNLTMKKIGVAIVGGGPAGLQTAITLAKKGIKPILFEEHSIIGEPIQCGEGLSVHAFKDFNLPKGEKSFCVKELDTCHLNFPENKTIFGDIQATMIRRDKFDQYLSKKAVDLGAEIFTATKVTDLQRKTDGVVIKTKDKSNSKYFAKIVVLAEGPNAQLAKTLGFQTPSPMIKAFEYKVKEEWSDKLEFYFDSKKFPFGYCWVFPREGETNIGIVTTAKDRKQRLDNFLRKRGITGSILKKVGGQIPMHGPLKKLYHNRVLLVGDTAGMVNPIFYGGIRMAMTSGRIAGNTVAEILKLETNQSSFNLKMYEEKLRQYKFMKRINFQCHRFFYTRSNKFLTKLGEVFDNRNINQIEGVETLKTLGKILLRPSLLTNPIGLYWLYKGFKVARDWGF